MPQMLNIDDAIRQLTAAIEPVSESEDVALASAASHVLAADVNAPISLPPFNSSAMDGYAVRVVDCDTLGTELQVIGTSFAGKPFDGKDPAAGSAIRIFTGAAVPTWADAVVIQEDVDREGQRITVNTTVKTHDNIRFLGHDVHRGEKLLGRGTRLGPFEVGWLAACGVASISVARRIRVALFSTGDELQDPGEPLGPGQIYDSNRTALIELLRHKPAEITDLGRLPDEPNAIERALKSVINQVDLIVTSGGVSVGDADFVRPVIEKLGDLSFWNVALKPGKPIAFATLGTSFFLGLPGNPVSAIVTYLLFVAPAIDALSGVEQSERLIVPAELTDTVRHSAGRREFQRGVLTRVGSKLCVKPTGDQSSNRLATFAGANCLIVVPEQEDSLDAGQTVDVLMLPSEAHHL